MFILGSDGSALRRSPERSVTADRYSMNRLDIESRIPTSGLRSSLANDRHALNFNHDPPLREVGNSDQRAGGEFALREHLVAQFHELVAIPGIIDKDGHGHQVPEASSTALQGSVD